MREKLQCGLIQSPVGRRRHTHVAAVEASLQFDLDSIRQCLMQRNVLNAQLADLYSIATCSQNPIGYSY